VLKPSIADRESALELSESTINKICYIKIMVLKLKLNLFTLNFQ
jgi:hypothetical protein